RPRAYTSVMSLLGVMTEKRLLVRKPRGRAYVYSPRVPQAKTTRDLLTDLLGRAFDGSASLLVSRLLEETQPSAQELDEIRRTIAEYESAQHEAGQNSSGQHEGQEKSP